MHKHKKTKAQEDKNTRRTFCYVLLLQTIHVGVALICINVRFNVNYNERIDKSVHENMNTNARTL